MRSDVGIHATPHPDNPRYFSVVISGPQDSAYDGQSERNTIQEGVVFVIPAFHLSNKIMYETKCRCANFHLPKLPDAYFHP
jgi:hypothetical protein